MLASRMEEAEIKNNYNEYNQLSDYLNILGDVRGEFIYRNVMVKEAGEYYDDGIRSDGAGSIGEVDYLKGWHQTPAEYELQKVKRDSAMSTPTAQNKSDAVMITHPLPNAEGYLKRLEGLMPSLGIGAFRKTYRGYSNNLKVKAETSEEKNTIETLDKVNSKVGVLQKFWDKLQSKGIDYSSGYGISAVAFVPKGSSLHKNLVKLMEALEKTNAAKAGKLVFNSKDRLHMTVYPLETGNEVEPQPADADAKTELLRQQISEMAINNREMKIVYGKDVFISPKARIGINGYIENEALVDFRKGLQEKLGHETSPVKGEHISLVSIIKDLTEDELKEIYQVIDDWKKKDALLSGWLNIREITAVYHQNDLLTETWKEDLKAAVPLDDYTKIQMAFQDLIGLTEEDLDNILPGRRDHKYRADNLAPLPFEGISVIHNISPKDAEIMQLSTMAQEFEQKLKDAGIGKMVAFVDLNSFHATTFDLINEPESLAAFADPKKNPGGTYKYKEVRKLVEEKTKEFLEKWHNDHNRNPLTATVKITGVGMFAPGIIKLNLKLDEAGKKAFEEFRKELQEYLLVNAGEGYKLWRQSVGGLSPHLTIGYVMNIPNSNQSDQKFIEILKEINKKFQPDGEYSDIKFDLTQGELTAFTDMNHYEPVGNPGNSGSAMLNSTAQNKPDAAMKAIPLTPDQRNAIVTAREEGYFSQLKRWAEFAPKLDGIKINQITGENKIKNAIRGERKIFSIGKGYSIGIPEALSAVNKNSILYVLNHGADYVLDENPEMIIRVVGPVKMGALNRIVGYFKHEATIARTQQAKQKLIASIDKQTNFLRRFVSRSSRSYRDEIDLARHARTGEVVYRDNRELGPDEYAAHRDFYKIIDELEKIAASLSQERSKAMTAKQNRAQVANGGIDLNQIAIKRTGKTIKMQFDPAQLNSLEQGGFEGFTPVIINMTRISSPFQLLGVNQPAKEPELLAKV